MVSVRNKRAGRHAGKRILIVEDDFFVRDIYQKKLGDVGFTVDSAADGLEGMERLRAAVPDLILLDIFMPYVDGRDMLREIRHHEEWKDIPVILLTNFSANEGVRDGFDLGADEYLIKSHFTPSEVLEKVYSVFEKRGKNDIVEESDTGQGTRNTEEKNPE
jgi:DNA-binding response OmpR family regulator